MTTSIPTAGYRDDLRETCAGYVREWRRIRSRWRRADPRRARSRPEPAPDADADAPPHPLADRSVMSGYRGVARENKGDGRIRYYAKVRHEAAGGSAIERFEVGPSRESAREAADDALAILRKLDAAGRSLASWYYTRSGVRPPPARGEWRRCSSAAFDPSIRSARRAAILAAIEERGGLASVAEFAAAVGLTKHQAVREARFLAVDGLLEPVFRRGYRLREPDPESGEDHISR